MDREMIFLETSDFSTARDYKEDFQFPSLLTHMLTQKRTTITQKCKQKREQHRRKRE
jgi:hypothetical protein